MIETGFLPVAPIGPAIRKWQGALDAECPIDIEKWTTLTCTSDDPEERMAELRPKLYITGGMLAPLLVKNLIDLKSDRLPQGIVRGPISKTTTYAEGVSQVQAPSDKITTFDRLYKGLRQTALYTSNEFVVPHTHGSAAIALNKLVGHARKISPKEPRYQGAKDFLLAGLYTGIEMGVGALSGIAALADLERTTTTQEDFSHIAHNSRSLIGSVATLNLDQIDPFRNAMITKPASLDKPRLYSDSTPYFNVNLLAFEGHPDAADASVQYLKPIDQLVDPVSGKRIGDIESRFSTLTCLALPRAGENGSAIYELWSHLSGVTADMLYPSKEKV